MFELREIAEHCQSSPYRDDGNRFKIKQDGIWNDLDLTKSSILEINLPLLDMICHVNDYETKVIPANIQHITKLLSACVDHVDILLEDWYPTIGTRFMHTSEGRFLVTRLVPCPTCIKRAHSMPAQTAAAAENGSIGSTNDSLRQSDNMSTASSDVGSFENTCLKTTVWNYLWTIEECVLSTYDKKVLVCPMHGDIPVVKIAPDLVNFTKIRVFMVFLNKNRQKLINRLIFSKSL